ncbi:MAG: hypothetical protein ACRCUM_01565 [Mycoplasmoidaceae bacterium]
MNFVALIGLITHIENMKNQKYIEMEINSANKKSSIAKIIIDENNNDLFNKISLGVIIGINGFIDFSNSNRIVLKNYTLI